MESHIHCFHHFTKQSRRTTMWPLSCTHRPLGSPGPAFTLAGRPAEPQPDPVPGPGAYDPEHPASPGREGPAYTFGARPPEHSPPASPGPGTYRPEGAASPTGPAYTMATRPLDRGEVVAHTVH